MKKIIIKKAFIMNNGGGEDHQNGVSVSYSNDIIEVQLVILLSLTLQILLKYTIEPLIANRLVASHMINLSKC